MAEQAKNTVIEIKADLSCSRCCKKIKRLLCKYQQIRNQIFNEKQNTVIITVHCCSPERIIRKLESKGGKTIHSIRIIEPEIKKPDSDKPKQEASAKPSPKKDAAAAAAPTPAPDVKPKSKPAAPVDAKPNQGAAKPETGAKPAEKQKEEGGKKGEGEASQGGKKQVDQSAGKKADGVKFIMDPVAAAPGYPSQWFVPPPQPTGYECYHYGYQGYGGRTGCDCGGRRMCQNRCDCNFSDENPTAACVIM